MRNKHGELAERHSAEKMQEQTGIHYLNVLDRGQGVAPLLPPAIVPGQEVTRAALHRLLLPQACTGRDGCWQEGSIGSGWGEDVAGR